MTTTSDSDRRTMDVPSLDDLVLSFQPQVDLRTREVIGPEALLRWRAAGRCSGATT